MELYNRLFFIGILLILVAMAGATPFFTMRTKSIQKAGLCVMAIATLAGFIMMFVGSSVVPK